MSSIEAVVTVVYLEEDSAFFYSKGDFIGLKTKAEDGSETDHGIVKLRRMFPFEQLWENISVLKPDDEEIGVIRSLALFPRDEALLRRELERVYFTPKISKIYSMKEKYGFSNWDVETDVGRITFSVKDTFRSLLVLADGRVIITDVDGGRYEIPDAAALDKASHRKIELYL